MKRDNNLKGAAPMPASEEDVSKNSMKLYSYLVCISGLADYPDNTRMFRQKNLILTKIKEATGITDKTVKLYLFYLERDGLVKYRGEYQFEYINRSDFQEFKEYREYAAQMAAKVWKERNKNEKNCVYHIPRPNPYTPIPEITLDKLNKYFKVTELELDLYLILSYYRDKCVKYGQSYKAMTFENIRDILNYRPDTRTNNEIFRALSYLSELGLIQFSIGYTCNSKLAKIPVFKIKEVGYYIGKPIINFSKNELITDSEVSEIKERVRQGFLAQEIN